MQTQETIELERRSQSTALHNTQPLIAAELQVLNYSRYSHDIRHLQTPIVHVIFGEGIWAQGLWASHPRGTAITVPNDITHHGNGISVDIDDMHLLTNTTQRRFHAQLGQVGTYKPMCILRNLWDDITETLTKGIQKIHPLRTRRDQSVSRKVMLLKVPLNADIERIHIDCL